MLYCILFIDKLLNRFNGVFHELKYKYIIFYRIGTVVSSSIFLRENYNSNICL